jgi:hypothetical protein
MTIEFSCTADTHGYIVRRHLQAARVFGHEMQFEMDTGIQID